MQVSFVCNGVRNWVKGIRNDKKTGKAPQKPGLFCFRKKAYIGSIQ
jgi:hypothetical protein